MGAPPPPTASASGLGGAFGGPSSSAGVASDYLSGAGTLSSSFSQPSSPSKGSADLKETYLRKVCPPPSSVLIKMSMTQTSGQIQEYCHALYDFAQKHSED